MKQISELQLGYSDAENYKRKENKILFNRVFIRNQYLDRLCEPSISFLVGEKGVGKTAYALYLSNNNYKNHFAQLRFIRETDYQKFIALKTSKNLTLSDYTVTWKVILLLLLSQQVLEREGKPAFFKRFDKFAAMRATIQEYYQGAFSPELTQAIEFVEESRRAAEIIAKYVKGEAGSTETFKSSSTKFQMNLFYIYSVHSKQPLAKPALNIITYCLLMESTFALHQ